MDLGFTPSMLFEHPLVQKYLLPIMLIPYLPDNLGLWPLKWLVGAFVLGYRIRLISSFLCARVTFLPDVLGVCREVDENNKIYDFLALLVILLSLLSKLPKLAKQLKSYPTFRFRRDNWEQTVKTAEKDECTMTEVVIVGAGIAGATLGLHLMVSFSTHSSYCMCWWLFFFVFVLFFAFFLLETST